ncbi:histidine--tRNA ligase [Clostridium felsineum]|uniref:Histidine--tRNA ligase n=1 Tax=Clostridium felsineum TaxID=36839 RepID=A0A1S8LQM3_9CLOT|nr:histidine--tRNA ligase [Clostridium felsineum]URZ03987.1 Histidine--tRNA ligase [Clostridium felsineum]URZ07757.1 Histidine--tRNA ligase [Clostridium felsineum]URZ12788.1 Histidine--tRNA ligase [Clostridium felsineum]
MSNKIKPSILPGFMELLPKEQLVFNDIVSKITGVYEQNGFLPMDTPIIEKEEVLLAKSAGETEKQVYRIDKEDKRQVLRFDLTVPFSRFAAQYMNDLTFPFKRYQLGKVYRGERNQKGRYREFYQCDVDVVGNGSLSIKNDAFVINMASKALKKIGLNSYKFQISNRKILTGILEGLNITNMQEVMILIDKYDKITEEQFLSDLLKLVGEENAKVIDEVIKISGSSDDVVEGLKKVAVKNEMLEKGIEETEEVIKYLKLFGVEDSEYAINLKIIRGLDYYTGTVFETLLTGNESYGSICSGGRYDNLAQNYTENVLPGVGMSIGITRLFFVLKEIGFIENYKGSLNDKYLIIPIGETFEYCTEVLNKLLQSGKSAEIYFEDGKLKKKLTYANKLDIKYVILIGEDEVTNSELVIKDMVTGEQKKLKIEEL